MVKQRILSWAILLGTLLDGQSKPKCHIMLIAVFAHVAHMVIIPRYISPYFKAQDLALFFMFLAPSHYKWPITTVVTLSN